MFRDEDACLEYGLVKQSEESYLSNHNKQKAEENNLNNLKTHWNSEY